MSEKLQDIMLIEKMLERRTSNDNNSIQGLGNTNYQMPFVLLLLFVLYIIWQQQQDLRKELYLKNPNYFDTQNLSKHSEGFQIPFEVQKTSNRINFQPKQYYQDLFFKNTKNNKQINNLNYSKLNQSNMRFLY